MYIDSFFVKQMKWTVSSPIQNEMMFHLKTKQQAYKLFLHC